MRVGQWEGWSEGGGRRDMRMNAFPRVRGSHGQLPGARHADDRRHPPADGRTGADVGRDDVDMAGMTAIRGARPISDHVVVFLSCCALGPPPCRLSRLRHPELCVLHSEELFSAAAVERYDGSALRDLRQE
eukprot:4940215-Pyramimonas_sp.AAC.1